MPNDNGRSIVDFLSRRFQFCQSLFYRFRTNGCRFSREYLPVTHAWQNSLLVNSSLLGNFCKLVSSSDTHLVTYHSGPDIESTPENPWKAERVVDLVRKVRSACCDYP